THAARPNHGTSSSITSSSIPNSPHASSVSRGRYRTVTQVRERDPALSPPSRRISRLADENNGAAQCAAAFLIGLPSVAGLAGSPFWTRPGVPQAAARLFLFVAALRVRAAFLAAPG